MTHQQPPVEAAPTRFLDETAPRDRDQHTLAGVSRHIDEHSYYGIDPDQPKSFP